MTTEPAIAGIGATPHRPHGRARDNLSPQTLGHKPREFLTRLAWYRGGGAGGRADGA
jgi:hypothetical protein